MKLDDLMRMMKNAFPKRPAPKAQGFSRFDKRLNKRKIVQIFTEFLTKLGYEGSPRILNRQIILVDAALLGLVSIVVIIYSIMLHSWLSSVLMLLFAIWTFVFAALYIASVLAVLLYLDIRLYQRVKQIEEALPDFLQLTASNISAGMTIDRALWYAVRPKFGILAKEMEDIAKATLTGEDLEKALVGLSKKYNSRTLKESVNLIVAGMHSGGEMAGLLNKVASNIKETELIKKEASTSVTTYVIFIVSATIIAAPILFALSTELLIIIRQITSSIQIDKSVGSTGFFSFDFSGEAISIDGFKQFSIAVLVISSFFSAAITSTIRKGTVKDGLKMIPIFIAVSIVLYLFFTSLFAGLLGGMFG